MSSSPVRHLPRAASHTRAARRVSLLLAAVMALAAGCGSSQLLDVWRNPNFAGPALSHVLVIAVEPDSLLRRSWEDSFVFALRAEGAAATAAAEVYPEAVPDTHQVLSILLSRGFDGIVVIFDSGGNEEEQPFGATGPRVDWKVVRPAWATDYHDHYVDAQEPDSVDLESAHRKIIDFWSTRDGVQLVWTGVTESIPFDTPEEPRREITSVVVSEWRRTKLLP